MVIDFCHQTVTWVTAEISMAAYVIDGGVTRVTVEISMAAKTVTWVGLVHFYIRGHPSSCKAVPRSHERKREKTLNSTVNRVERKVRKKSKYRTTVLYVGVHKSSYWYIVL